MLKVRNQLVNSYCNTYRHRNLNLNVYRNPYRNLYRDPLNEFDLIRPYLPLYSLDGSSKRGRVARVTASTSK